jgi:MinD-like ATPase involved in chromosome partitioning or flagellar assembly
MPKIIVFHSFRRGTGKSCLAVNSAVLYALRGLQVGIVDINLQSPSLHFSFGLPEEDIRYTLNDFLGSRCSIEHATHDMTQRLDPKIPGRILLIPASPRYEEIWQVLHNNHDLSLLEKGLESFITSQGLDILILDTCAGLNDDTLFAAAISDSLAILMRPDHQDYQGTAVTVDVAQKLQVPRVSLIANLVPKTFDPQKVSDEIEKSYGCEVTAVIPLCMEIVSLESPKIFTLEYTQHPVRYLLEEITKKLVL